MGIVEEAAKVKVVQVALNQIARMVITRSFPRQNFCPWRIFRQGLWDSSCT